MAALWADGFDFYGAAADVQARYAASSALWIAGATSTPFGIGQALTTNGGGANAYAGWGSNEGTIYGTLRLKLQSGGSFQLYFQDGNSNQCSILWGSDGAITVYSGGTNVLLQKLSGAFSLSTWDSYQFKLVIHPTAGSVEIRKNGSASPILSLTGVNTRNGTANAYASTGYMYLSGGVLLDDLFLASGSGAAPNTWLGDLRAMQQVPASTVQAQWTPSAPTAVVASQTDSTNYINMAAGSLQVSPVQQAQATAMVSGGTFTLRQAASGHVQVAIYDATGTNGAPGALLGVSTPVTNPAAGANSFVFPSPFLLTAGRGFYVALLCDVAVQPTSAAQQATYYFSTATSYAAGFPNPAPSMPPVTSVGNMTYALTASGNAVMVAQSTEDGDATFVASSTVGVEDIYALSAIPTTYAVVGVNFLACWRKSDAGPRTVQLSTAANGSADTPEIVSSSISGSYGFTVRFAASDPTGATWTPATVNAQKLGLSITA